MSAPRVSVLLPVGGREPHLAEALASVADQRFGSFEVVAVTGDLDPGTAAALDDSPTALKRVRHDGEGGLAGALNAGLARCRGDLIARFDADDVMRPDRLGTQVTFLDAHPDIGVLGTGFETVGAAGERLATVRPPHQDSGIRWELLTRCPIAHPTVMVRHDLLETLDEVYRPRFDGAEDYDLWTRLLPMTRFANVREPLLSYRVEGERKSQREAATQREHTVRIAHRTIDRELPGIDLDRGDVRGLIETIHYGETRMADDPATVGRYLALLRAFETDRGGRAWTPRAMAATRLARRTLSEPLRTTSPRLLLRLAALYPLYPIHLVASVLGVRLPATG